MKFIHSKFAEYWRCGAYPERFPRFFKVKDRTEHFTLSKLEAIRHNISGRKHVSNYTRWAADSLDPGSLNPLGGLICFQTHCGSIVGFREALLSTRQLQLLLLSAIPELRTSSCQKYLRIQNLHDTLDIWDAHAESYILEGDLNADMFSSLPDDEQHKVFSRIEKRETDASELIDLISAGYLKWEVQNLFTLACTLQDLKLLLSAAGVGGLNVSDFDYPHGICEMTDDRFQRMISQHIALRAHMQNWQAQKAGSDAYTKCRDPTEEFDCVLQTVLKPRPLAAAVAQRPDMIEGSLDIAMQKEGHIHNLVGEPDHVFLCVFSSHQAGKACTER